MAFPFQHIEFGNEVRESFHIILTGNRVNETALLGPLGKLIDGKVEESSMISSSCVWHQSLYMSLHSAGEFNKGSLRELSKLSI